MYTIQLYSVKSTYKPQSPSLPSAPQHCLQYIKYFFSRSRYQNFCHTDFSMMTLQQNRFCSFFPFPRRERNGQRRSCRHHWLPQLALLCLFCDAHTVFLTVT